MKNKKIEPMLCPICNSGLIANLDVRTFERGDELAPECSVCSWTHDAVYSKKQLKKLGIKIIPFSSVPQPLKEKTTSKQAVKKLRGFVEDPLFLLVDLFCGFGGTTHGFAQAEVNGKKVAKVIACINHDPKAIRSHWLNHRDVVHFEEDIRTFKLDGLIILVKFYRKMYPNAKLILWASLECTNFSKAKGGQARDADSRTLAEHLPRYISAINPDYLKIENVVEFESWGPLSAKITKSEEGFECCEFNWMECEEPECGVDGHAIMQSIDGDVNNIQIRMKKYFKAIYPAVPDSKRNGVDYMKWKESIIDMGYKHDNGRREINSADLGAYTSRNRLFLCFAKPGLPIVWPELTHSKKKKGILFGDHLKPWKPVKEVLNFSDEGESIFARKKDLSPNTLLRVRAGLVKYVAHGDKAFISKYYSGRPAGKVIPVTGPAGTVTCFGGQQLVQPAFLVKYNSMDKNGFYNPPSVDNPSPVLTTQNRLYLTQCQFLQLHYSSWGNISSVEKPCPTLSTKDRVSIVSPDFLLNYNHSSTTNDIDTAAPAIVCADKLGLCQPTYFIDKHFGKSQNQSIDQPAGTVMPNDKHRLVACTPFIMPTNFNNQPTSIEQPIGVITANRKHSYIVNPSHGGHTTSTDAPCPVIVARQDKAPLSVVQVECGLVEGSICFKTFEVGKLDKEHEYLVQVICPFVNGKDYVEILYYFYKDENDVLRSIKEFMISFLLVDIKMRMLRVPELLKIQGFPENYQMVGNQSDHKKFIGNSVVPLVTKSWAEAMAIPLLELLKAA